jgi:hypothetical protein
MAFSGRHGAIELALNALGQVRGLDVHVALVGSDERDEAFAGALRQAEPQLAYQAHANQPLGAKWQSAVALARATQPDHLLLLRAGDVPSPRHLEAMVSLLERPDNAGYNGTALRSWYDYNAGVDDQGTATLWTCGFGASQRWATLLSGRILRASALEAQDWRLFDAKASRRLDRAVCAALPNDATFFTGTQDQGGLLSLRGPWDHLRDLESAPLPMIAPRAVEFDRKEVVLREQFHLDEGGIFSRIWPVADR